MNHGARAYARKIFAVHVVLLLALLAVMAITAREIYLSAHAEALAQATQRQEILADQTARGVETFYSTIISDLELFRRQSEADDSSSTQPATAVTPRIFNNNNPLQVRERPALWNQLNGRATALFVYNRGVTDASSAFEVWGPHEDPTTAPSARTETTGRSETSGRRGTGQTGGRGAIPPPAPVAPRVESDLVGLVSASRNWLNDVDRPAVSDVYIVPDDSPLQGKIVGGMNLVAVPLGQRAQWVIVAVVPAAQVQSLILSKTGESGLSTATLADKNMSVIMSTTGAPLGKDLNSVNSARVKTMLAEYRAQPRRRTETIDRTLSSDGETISPRLLTIEPVALPQVQWTLLVSSPMSDVDRVVGNVFSLSVFGWAVLIVLGMAGILVSTAVQFIRGRVQLERVQHESLTRELDQARQIQLNWLPTRPSTGGGLDIAALNKPASHISGDFYNWFDLPDGRKVVTIGDVTGHGMAAAFLMATTQLLVRTTMSRLPDPGACMREVNKLLCTQVFQGQFVTMLIVLIDMWRGTLELANAGHAAPFISSAGGPYTQLPITPRLVLAVQEDQEYPTERYRLDAQTSVLLYTDGAIDVLSPEGRRLDAKMLRQLLHGPYESAESMVASVAQELDNFRNGTELLDDLTLVAIQARGKALGLPSPARVLA